MACRAPLLPAAFCRWLEPALSVFSSRCRPQAAALAVGALLAIGPRTVTNILRVLGLSERTDFSSFHRVLSRNTWSGLALARLLSLALVRVFAPCGPVLVGLDHTLERRRGPKIRPAAHYYDPVRSSRGRKITSRGLRWASVMLLGDVPFVHRIWALPMISALIPGKVFCQSLNRRYRPVTAWALSLLRIVRRWLPGRALVAVMDGEFASLALLRALGPAMTVVSRLRLDVRLFDPPAPRPPARPARAAGGQRAGPTQTDPAAARPGRALATLRPADPHRPPVPARGRIHLRHRAMASSGPAGGRGPLGPGPLPRIQARPRCPGLHRPHGRSARHPRLVLPALGDGGHL